MTIIINGTTGISGVDGSAGTPSLQGQDTNTGFFYGTDILGFSTGGSERMRLDASGNLGLGVTPSAWSAYKVLQISGNNAVYANGNDELGFVQNAYYNGGWKYGATGVAATWNYQYQGKTVWNTAPSGTAGNAISFTQAMTLDASGNLGVGPTSPSARLDVLTSQIAGISTGAIIGAGGNGGAGRGVAISLRPGGSANSVEAAKICGLQEANAATATAAALTFQVANTSGTLAERMRIDSSGNVGIGDTSPSVKLTVAQGKGTDYGKVLKLVTAASLGAGTDGPQIHFINSGVAQWGMGMPAGDSSAFAWFSDGSDLGVGTERMRIDSSGNVGIGTSNAANRLTVASSVNDDGLRLVNTNNANTTAKTTRVEFCGSDTVGTVKQAACIYTIPANANYISADMAFFTRLSDAVAERARITSIGQFFLGTTTTLDNSQVSINYDGNSRNGITLRNGAAAGSPYMIAFQWGASNVGIISSNSTSTSYSTSSDYRLKENIQPMQNALAVVQQLNPVTYTWKADGSEGQGFIAHELQAVVPNCVTGEKDAVDEEGNPVYQGIDTSFLVATLTKAIQELTARIEQLEAK